MSETLLSRFVKSPEGMKFYQQERVILDATERICEVMQDQDISRTELAKRIGKTKGYITQLLDGQTNMTIRTLSDVFLALDRAVYIQDGPLDATIKVTPTMTLSWNQPEDHQNSIKVQIQNTVYQSRTAC